MPLPLPGKATGALLGVTCQEEPNSAATWQGMARAALGFRRLLEHPATGPVLRSARTQGFLIWGRLTGR